MTIPSWYLVAQDDHAIPPATERFMAQRAGSTVREVRSSHVAMISRPDDVTDLIVDAAQATSWRAAEHHDNHRSLIRFYR